MMSSQATRSPQYGRAPIHRRSDRQRVGRKRAIEILAEEFRPLLTDGYAPRPDVDTAVLKASRRILTELGGL